jgi:uncharacterized membrane protein
MIVLPSTLCTQAAGLAMLSGSPFTITRELTWLTLKNLLGISLDAAHLPIRVYVDALTA